MICPSYSVLAECYDVLMQDVDYAAWADFYEAQFQKHLDRRPSIVLDLGCGTGTLTGMMASRGFDMIGIDLSAEMLSKASAAAQSAGHGILYLQQDMRAFDLYGSVDAVVCSLDGINYLTRKEDVLLCFMRVYTFLNEGGLFIFDVNTKWKFEHVFGDERYILEEEGIYLGWENEYNHKTGLCRFYLTFFCENENGSWDRFEEIQRERAYSDRTLKNLLFRAGLEVLEVVSDLAGGAISDTDERHYFICRRPRA